MMKKVIISICEWAQELMYWEQVALEKVLMGSSFTEENYDELLGYLLEDAQLTERKRPRRNINLKEGFAESGGNSKPIQLCRIENLQNVNALIPKQTLTFGSQLTAIFGRNGSGKSGYARVLGCAGFTRGDGIVLPNITKSIINQNTPQADIVIFDGENERKIHYLTGKRCPEMGSFYVFDSTSVIVHMCGKNAFSFSPAGLSALKTLATVTDEVRTNLQNLINEKNRIMDFESHFPGESEVKVLVRDISADTKIERLTDLAQLSHDEEKRIHELNLEISNIALEKTEQEIKLLQKQLDDLNWLHYGLRETKDKFTPGMTQEINAAIGENLALCNQVKELSIDNFQNESFSQIGTTAWLNFVQSAKLLGDAESEPHHPYPQEGDPCLLCQQALSKNAAALINRLWTYIEGETKARVTQSENRLAYYRDSMWNNPGFDVFADFTSQLDIIAFHDKVLAQEIFSYIQILIHNRQIFSDCIINKKMLQGFSEVEKINLSKLQQLISSIEEKLTNLRRLDLSEEIRKKEDEKRILEHRKTLSSILPRINSYIDDLNWAREADKAKGSTYHITRKYNELFDELVTNRYLVLFKQKLTDLGRPLKVVIKTSGRKGETIKQIILEADISASRIAEPERVLSEGEKRAVALADFLTEVALDSTSNGIILDDPVTSLDLEWRETIARMLANEATKRQVIVFTHDLPFLYLLLKHAESKSIEKEIHWIKRGDTDDQPGYVYLNNCPALENEYKNPTRAITQLENARKAEPEIQEAILKDGFGALRTTYEALIVFELFNGVVLRFDERISFGRLKEIAWDHNIVNDIIESCERLSRYIEGHLHSDAMSSLTQLSPDLLQKEIDHFSEVKKKIKMLKKQPQAL